MGAIAKSGNATDAVIVEGKLWLEKMDVVLHELKLSLGIATCRWTGAGRAKDQAVDDSEGGASGRGRGRGRNPGPSGLGTAYIVGRVCCSAKRAKGNIQILWLDTEFQSSIETIRVGAIQHGIDNY
ncbi:hypothetical protein ON010_g17690 [Phytophthora cinnamomi]|nr:hypothetical protein ON010_g17690 [Phytophthora cinnamomi]